jgi:hypothetical protein
VSGVYPYLAVHGKKAAKAGEKLLLIPAGKVRSPVVTGKEGIPGKEYILFFVPKSGASRGVSGQMNHCKGAYSVAVFKKAARVGKVAVFLRPKGIDGGNTAQSGFYTDTVGVMKGIGAKVFAVGTVNGNLGVNKLVRLDKGGQRGDMVKMAVCE